VDSSSRREPGSENGKGPEGGPGSSPGESPRVIRAPKPLARPKAPPEAVPEKKKLERTAPLKPGDRLWSKPKKSRGPATERKVYLSSEEYEAEHPEPAQAATPHRGAAPLPRAVGTAHRDERREDRRPGSSPKPSAGRRGDRPAYGKERPPRKFEGKAGARPPFRKEGAPKRFESKREERPAPGKERPPRRSEEAPPSRPEFRKTVAPKKFGPKRDGRPPSAEERPARKFEGRSPSRPESRREGPPKKFEPRSGDRPASGRERPQRPAESRTTLRKGDLSKKFEERGGGRPMVREARPSGAREERRPARPAVERGRPETRAGSGKPDLRARTIPKPLRAATPFFSVKDNLRAAAARVLFGVLERGGQLKSLVQSEQGRFSHEADRALVREIAAGVLRHLPHIDWAFEKSASRGLEGTAPEIRALVRVGLYQLLYLERVPVYAAVDQCVEAAKSVGTGAAGFVNGVLRTAAERRDEYREAPIHLAGAEGLCLRYGMPRWLVDRYLTRFGEEEAERLIAALQEPAGTTLFFPDAGRLAQARPILEREGFLQKPDSTFPLTLHVSGGNPADSDAFRRGLFYVADPASQVPALLLPVPPGGPVLDLCAAPGGKTVVLSGRVPVESWVLSTDVNRRRILRIEENVARLGLKNVRLAQVDAGRALPFGPDFASVLLDAPCSALGTLRRNPEIRWQVKPEGFKAFAERQRAFLGQAAMAVAPGGHLLYSVCSLEREETVDVVERFLSENRTFRPAPLDPPPFLAPLLERVGEGAAVCLPHWHAWDGFFVALFKKKG